MIGIDLSDSMVAMAQKYVTDKGIENTEFMVGDALSLDFEDNSFDVVFSSNAFPWVADQKQFLKEVNRVLKPDGKLGLVSLSTNVYKEFFDAIRHVYKRDRDLLPNGIDTIEAMKFKTYEIRSLSEEVKQAGFEVDKAYQLATEEPITPAKYLNRVNAIIDENYLEGLDIYEKRNARNEIYLALSRYNGALNITEASIFVFACKRCSR